MRPLAVLRRTMHHLLSVLPPHTRDLPSAYPFLCDRFRAVRQEMVMQGIGGQNALDLLLPMVSLSHFQCPSSPPLSYHDCTSSCFLQL